MNFREKQSFHLIFCQVNVRRMWKVLRRDLSETGRDFVHCQEEIPSELGQLEKGGSHFRKKQENCVGIAGTGGVKARIGCILGYSIWW